MAQQHIQYETERDIETEILRLSHQRIVIDQQIWTAQQALHAARYDRNRKTNTDYIPVAAISAAQKHRQPSSVSQNTFSSARKSTQVKENDHSNLGELISTPRAQPVTTLNSFMPGSGEDNETSDKSMNLSPIAPLRHNPGGRTNTQREQIRALHIPPAPASFSFEHTAQIDAQYGLQANPLPGFTTQHPNSLLSRARQQTHSQQSRASSVSNADPSARQNASVAQPMLVTASMTDNIRSMKDPFLGFAKQDTTTAPTEQEAIVPTTVRPSDANRNAYPKAVVTQPDNEANRVREDSYHHASRHGIGGIFGSQDLSHGQFPQLRQQVRADRSTPALQTAALYTMQDLEPPNNEPLSENRVAPDLGRGMKRKTKPQHATSHNSTSTDRPIDGGEEQRLRRRRSPSLELTDQRPRQRQRVEDRQVITPPLNTSNELEHGHDHDRQDHVIHQLERSTKPSFIPIDSYNAAPPLDRQKRTQENNSEANSAHSSSQPHILPAPPQLANTARSRARDASDEEEVEEPAPRRRQNTGTPALLAEVSQSNPGLDPDAPRPARPRKPVGYHRVATWKPLSPSERHSLEMRFCAHVARIVGSKICVSQPPLPYAGETIYKRLKRRLGHERDTEGPVPESELYRTHVDFVLDAKSMLDDYVKLGACLECPFEKTGNARVMCYRTRLAAVIDLKMRELKPCLRACEYDFEESDELGRRHLIDEWFDLADFEPDGHVQS